MENIVLIGFMGTGKTAVGRILAKLLGYQFVDTDEQVEVATGLPVYQVCRKYGRIRFRSEEALVVKKFCQQKNQVIATGGDLIMNMDNLMMLKEKGFLVLLEVDPETIYKRVNRKNNRPMLGKKVDLPTLEQLMEERKEIYRQAADLTIEANHLSLEEIANLIIKNYREIQKEA